DCEGVRLGPDCSSTYATPFFGSALCPLRLGGEPGARLLELQLPAEIARAHPGGFSKEMTEIEFAGEVQALRHLFDGELRIREEQAGLVQTGALDDRVKAFLLMRLEQRA